MKICECGCNTLLVQRVDEPNFHFNKRRFVNKQHANGMPRKAWDETQKYCKLCDELLIRGESEHRGHFNDREFCNKSHAVKYRYTDAYVKPVVFIPVKDKVINNWLLSL